MSFCYVFVLIIRFNKYSQAMYYLASIFYMVLNYLQQMINPMIWDVQLVNKMKLVPEDFQVS